MGDATKSGQGCGTYALGRRFRRNQFWVAGFKSLQFAHQQVVLCVTGLRRILYVIGLIMSLNLAAQPCCTRKGFCHTPPQQALHKYAQGARTTCMKAGMFKIDIDGFKLLIN